MGKRGERRHAVREAAKQEAGDTVRENVALRVGQAMWYVATYPLRLLFRALDALL